MAATFVAAGIAVSLTGTSRAHGDPCHAARSCPSDDHSYSWSGMSCTSDPRERLPEDQLPVDYRGVRYWCHVVVDQGMTTPAGGPKLPSGCGADRGAVRTLSDPAADDVRPGVTRTTVPVLASLRPPGTFSRRGSGAEKTRYLVRTRLVSASVGPSGELLLVVGDDPKRRITARFPGASCTAGADARLRVEMLTARAALERTCGAVGSRPVRLRGRATITGVGFFSRSRVSGNGFALAPVLRFSSAACARRPA